MSQTDAPGAVQLPHLFSPLVIGPVTLKNRIVSAGHTTNMPTSGTINDAMVAYHEARAAGGTGLIVVQSAIVHETAGRSARIPMAIDDSCIPGYAQLAEACHAHGTVVFGQLFHPGREAARTGDGSAPVAYSASATPGDRFHVMPRPLTVSQIESIIDGYAAAAERLVRAGLDGVEIVCSHGYLPAQFLNPRVNVRDDAYGEPIRFLREIVEAVRDAVPDAAVGLRISVDEFSSDGLEPDEAQVAIVALADSGRLDYVSVTGGTSASLSGSDHIVPPMTVEGAYLVPHAARVKAAIEIPVIASGRINEPQQADRVLAAGHADACAMTRALISDPEMPRKAMDARWDAVRACIACNQACIGHYHLGFSISCIQYPETGRELQYGTIVPAAEPKRVLVAGAGPAGLKAAAVAAARGHDVTIHEAGTHIGGQVLLAERLPGRAEFGGLTTNLWEEVRESGARLVIGSRVDRALVERERPDVVVVATGGLPRRPEIELLGDPVILDAWEVLRGADLPDGRVVVADWRCDWVGSGVALFCAEQHRPVTLAVNGYMAGQEIQQYVRHAFLSELHRRRVTVVPLARLYGADDDTVYFEQTTNGDPIIIENVGCLVLAQGHTANDALADELAGSGVEVVLAGDCLTPRTAEEAVLEGLKVAASL